MQTNQPRPQISIQWHITTLCGNRCRHCYMQGEPTHEAEKAGALAFPEMLRVLDDLCEFEAKWGAGIEHFTLSGGDPLLYPQWRDFIRELRRRGKSVSLLGNPETLNEANAAFLAEAEILFFQMSLDGMRQTHDYFRSPGSFDRTARGLELLDRFGLNSNIMFTLFPSNQDQLILLMRYVTEQTPASSFSFDIGCQVGAAAGLPGCFDTGTLRSILTDYLEEKQRLMARGFSIRLAEKPNLLKLIRFEQQDFYPLACHDSPVVSGCYAGWTAASLLSDGTVLACRRFPMPAGKMPGQSFEDIFLGSELMKKFRRAASFKGCGTCDFYQFCRGCPALVHGLTGDPFAANPLCFRDQLAKGTENDRMPAAANSPLSLDRQAEFELVASMFSWRVRRNLPCYLQDKGFQEAYAALTLSREDRRRFMAGPVKFAQQGPYRLDNDQLVFLVRHFSEEPWRFKGKGEHRFTARERFAAAVFANLASQEDT